MQIMNNVVLKLKMLHLVRGVGNHGGEKFLEYLKTTKYNFSKYCTNKDENELQVTKHLKIKKNIKIIEFEENENELNINNSNDTFWETDTIFSNNTPISIDDAIIIGKATYGIVKKICLQKSNQKFIQVHILIRILRKITNQVDSKMRRIYCGRELVMKTGNDVCKWFKIKNIINKITIKHCCSKDTCDFDSKTGWKHSYDKEKRFWVKIFADTKHHLNLVYGGYLTTFKDNKYKQNLINEDDDDINEPQDTYINFSDSTTSTEYDSNTSTSDDTFE